MALSQINVNNNRILEIEQNIRNNENSVPSNAAVCDSNNLIQFNILRNSTFKISEIFIYSGCYVLNGGSIEFNNSNNWFTSIIAVKELKELVTFAGAIDASQNIPAILYLVDKEPIQENVIEGSQQYGIESTKISAIKKFNSELVIPNDAKYAVINIFKSYMDDTCIVRYGVNLENEVFDIKDFDQFLFQSLYGGIYKISELSLLHGCYVYDDNVISFTESEKWNSKVISINNLKELVTFASGNAAPHKIPAILYLIDKEPIQENVIEGSQQYGTISTEEGSIKKFNSDLVIPNDAKYAVINIFKSYMDDTCIVRYEGDLENKDNISNTFVVNKNPSPVEYGTIESALSAATEGDIIKIYEGIYEETHLIIKKDIKLIGIGDVEIRGYQLASTSPSSIKNISTLECYYGATLRNLKITCKNMRYPIHADFSNGNAKWDVENCTFIHYGNNEAYEYQISLGSSGTPNEIMNACSAWGGGTRGGDIVKCFNCTFISTGRAFSTHNNTNDTFMKFGGSHVVLDSCVMQSSAKDRNNSTFDFPAPLFVQSLDCPVDDCDVVVNNCILNGYIVFQNTSGDGWSNKLKLYNSGENKIAFSSYGSGLAAFVNCGQISTYESHYNKFPLSDNINSFINRGSSTIHIGKAVKKDVFGGVSIYNDTNKDVFGVALEEIPVGGIGRVFYKGYISRIYLNGIRTTNIADGDAIYVDSNGDFSTIGTKIAFYATDCQNIYKSF